MTRNSCLPLLVGLALLWSAKAAEAQVQGGGTPRQVPLWTDGSTLGDSVITQDPNTNNIGIGTVAPSATLTVVGAGAFDALGSARFDLFNTTRGDGYLQHVLDDGTWQIATIQAGVTRMVIDPNGNVGIGTVTPYPYKLAVNGQSGGSVSGIYGKGAFGVVGDSNSDNGVGVRGISSSTSSSSYGVWGTSANGVAVYGQSSAGYAGYFDGKAHVSSIPLQPSFAPVCFNAAGDLLQCGASSLRFKTDVEPFREGLNVVQRLRPISFTWKDGGTPDIGLGAEDVAQVAPSLTFTNSSGEPEGVKYERLNVVLINAVNEQQAQIQRQETQIAEQQRELAALKTLVCSSHPDAEVCR